MSRADEPFVNAVYLTATEDNEDKLQDLMLETVGAALATPGNRAFSILKSTEKPASFLIVERWDDDRALEAHACAPVLTEALAHNGNQGLVASGPSGSRWTRII